MTQRRLARSESTWSPRAARPLLRCAWEVRESVGYARRVLKAAKKAGPAAARGSPRKQTNAPGQFLHLAKTQTAMGGIIDAYAGLE
jgi:hypothetical protein